MDDFLLNIKDYKDNNKGSINIDGIDVAFCLCDTSGNIKYANQYLLKMIGYSREDFIDSSFYSYINVGDSDILRKIVAIGSSEIRKITTNFIKQNRSNISIEISVARFLLPENEEGRFLLIQDITDIVLMEERVHEKDELYRTIVNTSQEGIFIIENFKIKLINKQVEQILNLGENEILGRNILDFVYHDDTFLLRDNINITMGTKKLNSRIRTRFLNKLGDTVFLELNMKIIHFNGVNDILITAVDITHMINEEEVERKFSENLRFLNNTAIDFIRHFDITEIYSYITEKLSTMFTRSIIVINTYNAANKSFTTEYINGVSDVLDRILSFLNINLNKFVTSNVPQDIVDKLLTGRLYEISGGLFELTFGKINSFNARIIEKTLFINKIYSIGLSYSNKLYGSITILCKKNSSVSDINLIETFIHQASATIERQTLEQELDEEKTFQKRLIETFPFPTLITNEKGVITFASKNIIQTTGYSHTEIKGARIHEFTSSAYLSVIKEHIRLLNKKAPVSRIYLIKHKSGNELFCEVNADYIYGIAGERNFILGINDITERINYEVNLEKAKIKAEESDKLKTAFLSNMSHEIRTPLNGIIGFSELLKNQTLTDEEKKQFTTIISNSGKQLLSLINDIIDIARIESGEMSVEKDSFKLNELLDEIYRYFKEYKELGKLAEKNVDLILSLPSACDMVVVSDKNKLRQILTNLISNALKFTNKGTVEFGCAVTDDERQLKMFVKDTGIGISSDNLSIVFERFRQVDDSSSKKFSGSGLGLPITKSLVELLGGSIHVESVYGEGSTFYFFIPLNIGSNQIKKIEPVKSFSLQNKIMIAEDDDNNFDFLAVLLKKEFHISPIRARNGREAIDIFKKNPDIELIFMDMNMPEMDGYDATKMIKIIKKDVLIIAQTAYATIDEKKKCFDSGCDDYISKPINIERVYELLRKYLKK